MTTNKSEVVAWLHEARQDSDVITDKVRHVWGTPRGSMGAYSIPLIRLSDYEALHAENERLREALDHIGGLSRALRVGGPDPMDLEGLSNALEEAVDTARAALAASTGQEK